jgi:putative transposase
MDFMSDELYNGERIKLLTLVDNFTQESLVIEVSDRLGGQRLVEILIQVAQEKGVPETIRADNGPEFTSKIFD